MIEPYTQKLSKTLHKIFEMAKRLLDELKTYDSDGTDEFIDFKNENLVRCSLHNVLKQEYEADLYDDQLDMNMIEDRIIKRWSAPVESTPTPIPLDTSCYSTIIQASKRIIPCSLVQRILDTTASSRFNEIYKPNYLCDK